MNLRILAYALTIVFLTHQTDGLLRRCLSCRSRGELGTCKDPFTVNTTQMETEGKDSRVKIVYCASGWCGKIIENPSLTNEYATATQRMCFQRGPDDNEERCAYTTKNNKKVYMCLCLGDLCNRSALTKSSGLLIPITLSFVLIRWWL